MRFFSSLTRTFLVFIFLGSLQHSLAQSTLLFPTRFCDFTTSLPPEAMLSGRIYKAVFILPAGLTEEILRKNKVSQFETSNKYGPETYLFDENGQMVSRQYAGPEGVNFAQKLGFDDQGRLFRIKKFREVAAGEYKPDGPEIEWVYTPNRNVEVIEQYEGAGVVKAWIVLRDPEGAILQINEMVRGETEFILNYGQGEPEEPIAFGKGEAMIYQKEWWEGNQRIALARKGFGGMRYKKWSYPSPTEIIEENIYWNSETSSNQVDSTIFQLNASGCHIQTREKAGEEGEWETTEEIDYSPGKIYWKRLEEGKIVEWEKFEFLENGLPDKYSTQFRDEPVVEREYRYEYYED